MNKFKLILAVMVVSGAVALPSGRAAVLVLHQETFSGDPGSGYQGSGFSGVSVYTAAFGNSFVDVDSSYGSAPSDGGSFQGSFTSQEGEPGPETGTLSISDLGFLNYNPDYSAYSLAFAFYADVLPADMLITIGTDTGTYLYNTIGQVLNSGQWNSITVPYSSGWIGSGSSIPAGTALTYIDISWSRSGTSAQDFYVDDITLLGNTELPPEPTSVPEPDTLLMLGMAGVVMFALRRRLLRAAGVAAQA